MRLIILSGRSGSGKSTALNVLEDSGYNCIDNLPVGLLTSVVDRFLVTAASDRSKHVAVSIDARNLPSDLQRFPEIVLALDRKELDCEIVYLDALGPTLVKRFSETRRKHPLTDQRTSLREALESERELLEPIADLADLVIDTTTMTQQQLADLIRQRVVGSRGGGVSLLVLSFAYKRGVPVDADLVYDARCLPNPHWIAHLRPLTGKDAPVAEFLRQSGEVREMLDDIRSFVERWLPRHEANGRSYITLAIGCTGGQHRSVFLAEELAEQFRNGALTRTTNVLVRHRELARVQDLGEANPPDDVLQTLSSGI